MDGSDTERSRKAAIQSAWRSMSAGTGGKRLKLAYARLPTLMGAARRRYREIAGHTAVTTIVSPARALAEGGPPLPSVHPRCAEILSTVAEYPCEEQWQHHIRESLRSRVAHSHICPLGLHCSCVPIHLGDSLVGVAKVVLGPETSPSDVSAATATLALTVDLACEQSYVSVLHDELTSLQQRVTDFQNVAVDAAAFGKEKTAATGTPGAKATTVASESIVERVLDYLHDHYREPDVSLRATAAAAGCSENYVTRVFLRVVGQRMRSYITGLRVDDACRALLDTDRAIKVIAVDSGFGDSGELARAFRRRVGVSPSAYRRIFRGR